MWARGMGTVVRARRTGSVGQGQREGQCRTGPEGGAV